MPCAPKAHRTTPASAPRRSAPPATAASNAPVSLPATRRNTSREGAPSRGESCGISRANASSSASETWVIRRISTVITSDFRAKLIFFFHNSSADHPRRSPQSRNLLNKVNIFVRIFGACLEKRLLFASHRFPKRPGRARGLKGNAVKSGNSSRCCKLRNMFRHSLATVLRDGRRRNGNESEDLPHAVQPICTLRRMGRSRPSPTPASDTSARTSRSHLKADETRFTTYGGFMRRRRILLRLHGLRTAA